MRFPVVLLACAAALTPVAPAFAQPKKPPPPTAAKAPDPKLAEAKKFFDEGVAAYATGNYDEAIKAWQKAYEISQKPLIFESIANAYERLGDARGARDNLTKWRESAPGEEHELLDARIKNLDARVKAQEEAARKAAEEKARREEKERAERAAAEASKSKAWLPGAIVLGVGGLAAIAGGALDGVAASKRPDANACKPSGAQQICRASAKDAIEGSNRLALAGDITWIAGAAIAATGAVLIIVRRPPAPKKDAAPPPTAYVAPMGAGLLVGGRF
jgi:tetratricopeptide (TPR) repeat protein